MSFLNSDNDWVHVEWNSLHFKLNLSFIIDLFVRWYILEYSCLVFEKEAPIEKYQQEFKFKETIYLPVLLLELLASR